MTREVEVRQAFRDQARFCAALQSPFTAQLLHLVADRLTDDTAIGHHILTWPGDVSGRGASVPLRLAGGLHALVRGGQDADLAGVWPGAGPAGDDRLWQAVSTALTRHEAFLQDWMTSPPQTNEVRRAAVMIAAAHWLTARHGLPLVLSEVGTSAGLNLIWDRYALRVGDRHLGPADPVLTLTPDWRGTLPVVALPTVAARAGVDINPLDPVKDRERLLSYIWADQSERLARTEQALVETARLRPSVTRADALDWLGPRLATPMPGHLHLVFHSIAWQYLTPAAQARGDAILSEAGTRAGQDAPLARLAMEGDTTPGHAAITLHLWPEGRVIPMGRVDFHGRWIDWQAPPPQVGCRTRRVPFHLG